MKEQITIPKEWIVRLKYYTNEVRNTQGVMHESALNALLGYLDSLDILIDKK